MYSFINFALYQKPENVMFAHVGKTDRTSSKRKFLKTFDKSSLDINYIHI